MKNTVTTNTIFAETILVGGTIYNKSEARITGDKVGAENYATWKSAMQIAHNAFYKYAEGVHKSTTGKLSKEDVRIRKNNAMDALGTIFDLLGEINGFKLLRDEEMLEEFRKYAVVDKTVYVGKAMYVDTQVKNIQKELRNVHNGVNPEWLANKEAELEEKKEERRILAKQQGSGKSEVNQSSFNSFCQKFETKVYILLDDQAMKSFEEIEAEREAKRKERRKKTAEKKKTKKEAEAETKKEVA